MVLRDILAGLQASDISRQCFLCLGGLVLRSKGCCFPFQLLHHLGQCLCFRT